MHLIKIKPDLILVELEEKYFHGGLINLSEKIPRFTFYKWEYCKL
jgi:hypothetical protein